MKQKSMVLILLAIIAVYARAQRIEVIGRSFDYRTLSVQGKFLSAPNDSDYYVRCVYEKDSLKFIEACLGKDYKKRPILIGAEVVQRNGYTFFNYGAGKTKQGGYGRLFGRKVRVTDSAFLKNDTLIFKRTTNDGMFIHYCTRIFSDTVFIEHKTISIGSRSGKAYQNTPLASFMKYFEWPQVKNYEWFYLIEAYPLKRFAVSCKRIYQAGIQTNACFGYGLRSDFSSERQNVPSLFWLKHSGALY